jgi:hypothetical protein
MEDLRLKLEDALQEEKIIKEKWEEINKQYERIKKKKEEIQVAIRQQNDPLYENITYDDWTNMITHNNLPEGCTRGAAILYWNNMLLERCTPGTKRTVLPHANLYSIWERSSDDARTLLCEVYPILFDAKTRSIRKI